jgi:hypothetical protein
VVAGCRSRNFTGSSVKRKNAVNPQQWKELRNDHVRIKRLNNFQKMESCWRGVYRNSLGEPRGSKHPCMFCKKLGENLDSDIQGSQKSMKQLSIPTFQDSLEPKLRH